MELRYLRCFLTVAEELHFARAAERLHIEQSPLSRTIKELEEDLGVRLFIRNSRSTRLSRAGQVFMSMCRASSPPCRQAGRTVHGAAPGVDGGRRHRSVLEQAAVKPRCGASVLQCIRVPKMRSPASPRPGRM